VCAEHGLFCLVNYVAAFTHMDDAMEVLQTFGFTFGEVKGIGKQL
jgi:hypothetical protein